MRCRRKWLKGDVSLTHVLHRRMQSGVFWEESVITAKENHFTEMMDTNFPFQQTSSARPFIRFKVETFFNRKKFAQEWSRVRCPRAGGKNIRTVLSK